MKNYIIRWFLNYHDKSYADFAEYEIQNINKFNFSLNEIFKEYDLTPSQNELLVKLADFLQDSSKNVFLLKGYAGTGKTFISKGLTLFLESQNISFRLSAPTGMATKVISKKTKIPATTVYQMIYTFCKEEEDNNDIRKSIFSLRINEDNANCVYIIDESSLIADAKVDTEKLRFGSGKLLTDIIKYTNLNSNTQRKIIFIGDNAQLPPVSEDFSPALDKEYLEKNYDLKVKEYTLTDIARQAKDSNIINNSIKIRDSIENKNFNSINIDYSEDVINISSDDIVKKFVDIRKINKKIILLAYKNSDVLAYNKAIREHLFPGQKLACRDDIVLCVRNTIKSGIYLANGDFAIIRNIGDIEHYEISLKKQNKETLKIPLVFRNITLAVKTINDSIVEFQTKILDEYLHGKGDFTDDEERALFVFFKMRYKDLTDGTNEFLVALKNDPYFNALRIRFGYAITAHKAQGSEWEEVLVDCSFPQNINLENKFRWLYTAVTRSNKNLYLLNAPHFNPFSDIQIDFPKEEQKENHESDLEEKMENLIKEYLKNTEAKIYQIIPKQNQFQCDIQNDNQITRINFYYNKNNIITSVLSSAANNIVDILSKLKGISLNDNLQEKVEFQFDFLKTFDDELRDVCCKHQIDYTIEHMQYRLRYTFLKDTQNIIIDVQYKNTGIGFITTNNKENNDFAKECFDIINQVKMVLQ